MTSEIHWDVLDERRINLTEDLSFLKTDYYLAGGTALALQIGHRKSIDFDFFTENNFDEDELLEKFRKKLDKRNLKVIQKKENTLSVNIDGIEVSCFTCNYPLLKPLIETEYIKMASVKDIAAMKLSAITSRATMKDYVDLYYILQDNTFDELISLTKKKYPQIDTNVVTKGLAYFEDIDKQNIIFKKDKEVSPEKIEAFLKDTVKKYIKK